MNVKCSVQWCRAKGSPVRFDVAYKDWPIHVYRCAEHAKDYRPRRPRGSGVPALPTEPR